MNWVERLTPKNTEEVKPGLFIQKYKFGYRQIHPAAWDGKINWKNFLVGDNWLKHLMFFIILIVLCFSYYNNTKACVEFQANPCEKLPEIQRYCLDQEKFDNPLVRGENGDSISIQNNP